MLPGFINQPNLRADEILFAYFKIGELSRCFAIGVYQVYVAGAIARYQTR